MSFRNMLFFIAAAIMLGAVLTVHADVPQLISRRDILKSGGAPANTPDGVNDATSITELYTFDGETAGDQFGHSAADAGDVDDDGYTDLIIGAHYYDGPAGQNAGRAYVYSGFNGDLLLTFDGEGATDIFGKSVAGAGDVNNDGYADVVISAPRHTGPGGEWAGRVYVFSGIDGDSIWTFDGENEWDFLAGSVSSAGDVNLDDHADVIIGTIYADGPGSVSGRAYVLSGLDGSVLYDYYGEQQYCDFGTSVSGVGDVNGDNYPDFAVGSSFHDGPAGTVAGRAYVYSGLNGDLLWTADGEADANYFGGAVSGAGDINSDGYADVIISAAGHDGPGGTRAGRAYVFSGLNGTLLRTFDGEAEQDLFGRSVSNAGDVNNDGLADLIITAAHHDGPGGLAAGRAYVFSGLNSNLLWTFNGDADSNYLGWSASGAGDVNSDGFDDLLVGAYGYAESGDRNTGRTYVFSGRGIGCRTVSPYQNQIDVAQDTDISAVFDIEVDGSSITGSSIFISGSQSGFPLGIFSYDAPSLSMLFNPHEDFMTGEVVTGVMTDTLTTTSGYTLEPCVWQFTIEATAGSGTYDPHEQYRAPDGPFMICTADFDNDGDLDLANSNYLAGNMFVNWNDGDGTFSAVESYSAFGQPRGICAADFNLDGFIDIAVTNTDLDFVVILENSGGTTFGNVQFVTTGSTPWAVTAGDFNADGYPDLATANAGSDNITIILNDAGDLENPTPVEYPVVYEPRSIAAGDLDNDGDLDLVIASYRPGCTDGAFSILENNGAGGFRLVLYQNLHGCPIAIKMADLNGDGNLDLVIARNSIQQLQVRIGDGTAKGPRFLTYVDFSVGLWPTEITTGDFDGDGDLDLACSNAGHDNISVVLLDGVNSSVISNYPAGNSPFGITSGDLNGDGAIDLAVANYDVDSISVLMNIVPPCDCGVPGDVDGNGVPAPLDVSYLVNKVFKSQDALHDYTATGCPFENGDVDCSGGAPAPLDVSYLVNKVYKGQDALCDRCAE